MTGGNQKGTVSENPHRDLGRLHKVAVQLQDMLTMAGSSEEAGKVARGWLGSGRMNRGLGRGGCYCYCCCFLLCMWRRGTCASVRACVCARMNWFSHATMCGLGIKFKSSEFPAGIFTSGAISPALCVFPTKIPSVHPWSRWPHRPPNKKMFISVNVVQIQNTDQNHCR